jgi:Protein of unknown function (DUF2442)/Domain of unknown function (DUF4160)
MLTVLRAGPYRFFFYAGDRDEPLHVHVEREDKVAKFWLDPVRLQESGGFSRTELHRIRQLVQRHKSSYERLGMNTLAIDAAIPTAESVTITNDTLTVELSDGRSLSVPLDWFPRLVHATLAERKRWRLIGRGRGIHWDLLDEDIGVDGLLAGQPSGESQASFQKWLSARRSTHAKRVTARKALSRR